jgi:hypothetical protein
MHIFLPRNGALKTYLSHQKMRQNSRTATWVLKDFPGVNPRIPNKREGRGEGRVGEGEGMGKGGRGREGEMFQPPNFLSTRRLYGLSIYSARNYILLFGLSE